MAILKEHGLAAREYLVGVPALRLAILRARSAAGPGSDALVVSDDDLALARTHLAELGPRLEAADRLAKP